MLQFLAMTLAGCRLSRPRHLGPVSKLTISAVAALVAQVNHLQPLCAEASRPNFVVIMADDLGYGDIGCFGNQRIKTPFLDALAKGGIKFTDFHSSGTVCSPTRAGLMTGRYQQRAGIPAVVSVRHKHLGMSQDELTFAEVLQDSGYATAIFGKWHLGYQTKFNPVRQGFDRFRGYVSGNVDFFSHVDQSGAYDWWDGEKQIEEEGYTTHLITKHAVEFIATNKDKPFCLYLAHEAPHYPYQGPNDKPERTVGGKFKTQGARPDVAQAYKEMVEALDDGVGQVITALDEHALRDNTLVLFFSDNGANQRGSNGGLRGFKGSVWEGGHRVPAIANWPGKIDAEQICDELIITLDVFPTLVKLVDATLPQERKIDGTDLSPVLFESAEQAPRKLFWGSGAQRAMRDGSWKLVVKAKGQKNTPALFDLADDPNESTDVSRQHPERVKQMLAEIGRWNKEVGPSHFVQD